MQKAMIKQRREAKEEAYNGAYNGVNNYNESGWVLNVRAVRRKKPSPAAAGGREEADEKMEARKQMEEVEAVKRIRATEKRIYLKRQDEERKQMEKARQEVEERRRILRQKYEVAYDTQYIQTSQTSTSLLKHAVMNKKGKHSHDNSCMWFLLCVISICETFDIYDIFLYFLAGWLIIGCKGLTLNMNETEP